MECIHPDKCPYFNLCLQCSINHSVLYYELYKEWLYSDVYKLSKYEPELNHFENIKYCKLRCDINKNENHIKTNNEALELLKEVEKRLSECKI